jgi:hypothetical protein
VGDENFLEGPRAREGEESEGNRKGGVDDESKTETTDQNLDDGGSEGGEGGFA